MRSRRWGDARAWHAAAAGLFGDCPHLRLDESRWDAAIARATNLNWVVDGETFAVTRYGTVTQAYTESEYMEILDAAGFTRRATYPSLAGGEADAIYTVMVASA